MPFKKGHKKVGGRGKGTPNKSTKLGAEKIQAALEDLGGFDFVKQCIKSLVANGEFKEAANLFMKLTEFAYPKLKAVDMSTTIKDEREELTPQEVEERLKEIQEELKQFDDD
jgi:hypothetical protein